MPSNAPGKAAVWLALVPVVPVMLLAGITSFNGLYGQDPYAYFDYATGPLRDSLVALETPPPFFWPPGYPLLVALMSFPIGRTPLAGQLVSLAAAAAIPVFTALLAREVWWQPGHVKGVPLLAGLVVGCTGQLWLSGMVVMSDTTGLAAATAGMWCVARFGRRAAEPGATGSGWLALAAGAMSFAVLTRWAYAVVAVPCTGYALTVLGRRPRARALRDAAVAAAIVLVVLAPLIPGVIHIFSGLEGVPAAFAGNLQVHGWNPANALRNEFQTVDGLLQYRFPNGLYYALAPAHTMYLTPLFGPLAAIGLWEVARRPRSAAWWLVIGWAGAVYLFHAGDPYQNLRFALAYLPPVSILAAQGAFRVFPARWRRRPLQEGAALVVLAFIAFNGTRGVSRFIERRNDDLATVRWVEAQTPPDARLIVFELTLTVQHESSRETHELFFLTPDRAAALLDDRRPTYLLIDVEDVRAQWRDRPPNEMYQWLDAGPGLVMVGRHRHYTLFRIGSAP